MLHGRGRELRCRVEFCIALAREPLDDSPPFARTRSMRSRNNPYSGGMSGRAHLTTSRVQKLLYTGLMQHVQMI